MADSLTLTPRLSMWPVFQILASGVAGMDQLIFHLSIGYMNLSHSSTCPYPKKLI
ncbi:hypothetical protein PAXRUDRAFT_834641 [Paxillus rubicundulus Ve08.2h10]|uniref:Uncharacterized protein n=1 Tax=Paxillus rubicundulus Ve08.2h10 TaxID=930991 RepID=A0A0D0DC76_9AGAM|nr:hypothetical protein PAXRUDRAFT_834641 [Paxillus rubicundulus Ve08.2h10]